MSRARHKEHKERANGGAVKQVWNAGGEQNAAKEAEEKKRGGRVHHHGEGEEAKHRMDKRARGGAVARKHGGHVEEKHEEKEHKHMHKGRARGGRIGADKHPLSSAAKVKHITPGETPEEGDDMVK